MNHTSVLNAFKFIKNEITFVVTLMMVNRSLCEFKTLQVLKLFSKSFIHLLVHLVDGGQHSIDVLDHLLVLVLDLGHEGLVLRCLYDVTCNLLTREVAYLVLHLFLSSFA